MDTIVSENRDVVSRQSWIIITDILGLKKKWLGQESNHGTRGCQAADLTTKPWIDTVMLQTISRIFLKGFLRSYSAYQFTRPNNSFR